MNTKNSTIETSEQAQSCAGGKYTSQLTPQQIVNRITVSQISLLAIRDTAWLSLCGWMTWETPTAYKYPGAQNREIAAEMEVIAWCEERLLDWTPEHQLNACLI